jgi:hypothetical protein
MEKIKFVWFAEVITSNKIVALATKVYFKFNAC